MTSFKVGDKVRVIDNYYANSRFWGGIGTVDTLYEHDKSCVGVAMDTGSKGAFYISNLERITDVWEWLVEQSYLSEHDGEQAKAEYEAFHTGVDALPTEVGWYESPVCPLRDGYNPYRLEWGIWYQMTDDGLEEISHEEMLELMPLTKLGAEADEEQAEGANA